MKIGIDARPLISAAPRGIGVYLNKIVDYINGHDRENTYILYTHKPFDVPRKYNKNLIIKVIPSKIGTIWLRLVLPKFLRKDKPDVFWGTSHMLPPKVKGIKYIVTFHDLGPLICPKWYIWYNALFNRLLMRKSAKSADIIISVSKSTKRELINRLKIDPSNIECIYEGGADLSDTNGKNFDIINKKFGISKPFFLYIGAIMSDTNKNIETIIQSFECLSSRGVYSELVLAGKLQRGDKLISMAERSEYKYRIKFTGYISDEEKIYLYQNAAAFVFPTLYEGFGIPVLEAMTIGTPVICSSNSSLPEVGGNAAIYLENERNAEELADKMNMVLNFTQEEREETINRGIEQAKNFSWEKCAQETLNILTKK